jgi:hypothetical protein
VAATAVSPVAGNKTIRLPELAIPSSTDSTTAVLMAGCIPKSSQLTINSRGPLSKTDLYSIVSVPPKPEAVLADLVQ